MAWEPANREQIPQLVEEGQEEVMPQWLQVLLRTRFWEPCSRGHKDNRAEDCVFCIHCYQVFCPHCTHDESGHCLLKVRRYMYRSVLLVKDMQKLNVDVSRIQTYIVNGEKGVYLRPISRSPSFRPSAGAPSCITCGCWLRTVRSTPDIFCSLTCKKKADVSQDDFSGPEAERRYRNIRSHKLQPVETDEQRLPAEPDHGAEVELPTLEPSATDEQRLPAEPDHGPEVELPTLEPSATDEQRLPAEPDHGAEAELPALEPAEASLVLNNLGLLNLNEGNHSFRTRPRKQATPRRAPFY